jgi:N utilization substance protein A
VLKSNNPRVDPVGSCVGIRGVRIKPIIEELQGERIDLIPYTEDISKFIAYSLSPWKPLKVEILDYDKKEAKVYLPKNIYDLALKNNININLAKELTGWNIHLEVASNDNSEENLKKENETTEKK